MASIEISGLSQCLANMKKLATDAQREIGAQALRDAGWEIAKPMRAATYTTGFKRITGAIQKGISVAVQHDPKADELKAYVVEYPQSIAGAETPFKALVRKRATKQRRGKVDIGQTAYWWLFLERGTRARKSVKAPRGRRPIRPGTRSARARARWEAAPSRGGIRKMPWLKPTFEGTATAAILKCRETFLKLVEAAVSAMPKK